MLKEQGFEQTHIASSRDVNFEQQFLSQTAGQGMDVVLNSLAREYVDASLRLLPRGGRFLEGVSKIASKLLVSEPPNIEDDYVSVYFNEGGRKLTSFYKDSRSKEESLNFTVETSAKSGEAVDLSFAFTGKTEGLDVTLTDLSSLKQVALGKEGKYSYTADGAPHSFKLDVKDKAKEEAKNRPLNITQLLNYPNPDRVGNTTFKYSVDGNAASVTIEVYTMTGKLIDKIAGELDGDTVWKFGDSLPNGVYVYRLVVTDVNGSKVSKINKLVVLK